MGIINRRYDLFFSAGQVFCIVLILSMVKDRTWLSVDSLDPEIFEASSVPQNDKVPHVYCLFKIM